MPKISKRLKNKVYRYIKLTTKRFRWKVNDWIASTDSFTLRLKVLKTTGDCKETTDMTRLIIRTHKSCRWCLIKEAIANRGTQRPNVSKYARSVLDGFYHRLEACLINLELP